MYLHPRRARLPEAVAMEVGKHDLPDAVLEVDHTTNVYRGKLRLYEAWGFPEVWVEAPDRRTPSRPRGTLPGLTIHLLEEGAYRESRASRAFPGWRAEAIHDALNEVEPSAWTHARLERLGRTLGERDGTGPDDDPLLRSLRGESREEGEARGRAKMARQILRSRGIETSAGFPADLSAFHGSSEEAVVAAALACDSERDFRARIREPRACRGSWSRAPDPSRSMAANAAPTFTPATMPSDLPNTLDIAPRWGIRRQAPAPSTALRPAIPSCEGEDARGPPGAGPSPAGSLPPAARSRGMRTTRATGTTDPPATMNGAGA